MLEYISSIYKNNHNKMPNANIYSFIYKHNNNKCLLIITIIIKFHI